MPKEPSSVKREKKTEVHTLKSRVEPKWISEKFSYQKRTKAKLQVEKKWDFGKDFFSNRPGKELQA